MYLPITYYYCYFGCNSNIVIVVVVAVFIVPYDE